MSEFSRSIAVQWTPPNPQSTKLFNVELDTTTHLKLRLIPQTNESFILSIPTPKSSWLTLSKDVGRPPLDLIVTIDTTGLQAATGYKEMLEFKSKGQVIHVEPIYLTTKVYSENALLTQPYTVPLAATNPKRNIFFRMMEVLRVGYHLIMTSVYLLIGGIALLLVVAIVMAILAG